MREKYTLLRQRRFDVTSKARKVALLETLIVDFERSAARLAQEVAAEEERTRIKDLGHPAYSTLAQAVALRRSNLLISVVDLKSKLNGARRELHEVTTECRDIELAESAAGPADQSQVRSRTSKKSGLEFQPPAE